MAALRPVEERDSKGATVRINPTIVYKQDQMIRTVRGRHDFALTENAAYHAPITAQVQGGKIIFFQGTPETSITRKAATEMKIADVPAYIINELKKRPMKVREQRPMVYEVKVVTIGDQEVTTVDELYSEDGVSVTVTPVAPEAPVEHTQRRRRTRSSASEQLAEVADEAVEG